MNAHPPYEALINYAAGDSLDEGDHITRCAQCGATVARYRNVHALYHAGNSVRIPAATLARAYSLYHPRRSVSLAPSPLQLRYSFALIALAVLFFCAGILFAQNSPFSVSIIIGPKDQDIQAPVTAVIGVPLHTPLTTPVQQFAAPESTPTVLPSSAPLLIVTAVPPEPTDAQNQVPLQTQAPQLPLATAQATIVEPDLPPATPLATLAPPVVATPASGSEILPTPSPERSTDQGTSSGSQSASAPASQPASAPVSQPASAPASQPASAPAPQPSSAPAPQPSSAPAPVQPPVPPKPPPNVWLSGPVKSP